MLKYLFYSSVVLGLLLVSCQQCIILNRDRNCANVTISLDSFFLILLNKETYK